MRPTITAIILARDEESMIEGCINSLRWCDEVLVIDNNSVDQTAQKAESLGARVVKFSHSSFARMRNEALKHADNDWVFYIDADERVTPTFAKEVLVKIETGQAPALSCRRENYAYGHHFRFGGWQQDIVTRVFQKSALKEWQGEIHESPVFEGKSDMLHSALIHLTHRSTAENLRKSANWTKIEAELFFKAGSKPVTFFTLIRKGVMEFFRRAFIKGGYRDGLAGLIEALVQGMNRVMVYIQIWELQQQPTLPERYQKQEERIRELWKQEQEL